MNTALVVPTNRPEQLQQFLDAWQPYADWNLIVVVEDAPSKTPGFSEVRTGSHQGAIVHYSWKEIDAQLGEHSWIISRGDSAIRSFGFLMAYQLECDYIATLDDDCLPYPDSRNDETGPFLARHIAAMQNHKRWVSTVPNIRPPGLPYRNLGQLSTVLCNIGLWAGVPDQDSVQALQYPVDDYTPRPGSFLVPVHQYTPLCGMNLCFLGEAAPLFYFGLQGNGWPYSRFDDIWCGVIAKKIIDYLGCHMAVGEPFVLHRRASDPFTNLVREAPGIAYNELFWELIDKIELTGTTPLECMTDIGAHLAHEEGYLGKWGEAILIWCKLLGDRDAN